MTSHASLPRNTALAVRRPHANRDSRQPPTVVFPSDRPSLTGAAARALLRIVLEASAPRRAEPSHGPQPVDSRTGILRMS
jgi:hypothetical protein